MTSRPVPGRTETDDERPVHALPGDVLAVRHGCRCPILANRPAAGGALVALVAPDCPLHRPEEASS